MVTEAQRSAAKKNIKKATAAAKEQKTISKLPKATRTALGKQANKVKREQA
jgi:ABC-type transport system involved in Fe-S cluster assembly fused permease/ATPase subunit